ncbi:hypothetical protein [Falsirhodobacter xinxiangensis]|uniref:hypothetical protein n=1 Tax=Falsirhodobacter xinxiangensis TaxID=2530049 RepID=UPI0010AA1AA7|nr:hypothetical protein [Rhodobacter xinxiangensis]
MTIPAFLATPDGAPIPGVILANHALIQYRFPSLARVTLAEMPAMPIECVRDADGVFCPVLSTEAHQ